ncbi:50S ribosomal protein L29 [Candidatus Schneideria nysicola]|uniref:50S ribosomal protein L29 n=1 Tax=Candidatus Schneideria nysicola TaxID=1081631 RepID=UPI001CAA6669|nr:50S ribosomal protein L29 [Candidatus Schneideria nysicola]UAJ65989.1 50S ribosomal protein L29 [Candidatus Schneideria nysicola]
MQKLRKKNIDQLKMDLINMLREKFTINFQKKSSKSPKEMHLLKKIRCNIARIKTVLTERKGR